MAELDYHTDGFETGELITISGYTGMGKTLFLKSLIRSFGIEKAPVCVFSYEDRVENYLLKFQEEEADYPIYVPLSLNMGDLGWLEERIIESKLKYNTRIVTIDHLHYLVDSSNGNENMSLKMGSIMRFLKRRIAVDHNMIVFVVAHQGKAKDESAEASLETIRDSGLISNESDTVIVVQRTPDIEVKKKQDATYDQNYASVKVEKCRRTGTYKKKLTFQKTGNWLAPL